MIESYFERTARERRERITEATKTPFDTKNPQHSHDTASHREDHVFALHNHMNEKTAQALAKHIRVEHPGLKVDPRKTQAGASKNTEAHAYEHHLMDFGTLQSGTGEQRGKADEMAKQQQDAQTQQQSDSHEVAMAQAKAIEKQPAGGGAMGAQKSQAITIKIPSKSTESFTSVSDVLQTLEATLTEVNPQGINQWTHGLSGSPTKHLADYQGGTHEALRTHLENKHSVSAADTRGAGSTFASLHKEHSYRHSMGTVAKQMNRMNQDYRQRTGERRAADYAPPIDLRGRAGFAKKLGGDLNRFRKNG